MSKKDWSAFTGIVSKSYVRELIPQAMSISPSDLMDMQTYRRNERMSACNGVDPIRVIVAYAQDELMYDGNRIIVANPASYESLPRDRKVNKFGLAYRRDAKLWLHKTLADITIDACIYLHKTQGWSTILYDGLRTVDAAYAIYRNAADSDMESGLLSLPGSSSHNKGFAIDSMMDRDGNEIDVGAHFDHLDMKVNARDYAGISPQARHNRLIREAAFLRAAFARGILLAPLRSEFWHDQLPENREDLWRVMESAARCLELPLFNAEDEALRKTDRKAFEQKWERWSYAEFLERWKDFFKGHEKKLGQLLGTTTPPPEKPESYHGNYNPLYDEALRLSGKHLT